MYLSVVAVSLFLVRRNEPSDVICLQSRAAFEMYGCEESVSNICVYFINTFVMIPRKSCCELYMKQERETADMAVTPPNEAYIQEAR